ncbi:MAG: CPBP family intramembrane metalloprotease [Candidatus Sumerlaeia bacterium]|nr:CPBP family intramembrane metalloprotease [Candidatus Sumerlaeia bacterium]
MSYPDIAQTLYGFALVGLMAWALFRVVFQPSLLENLERSPSALIWKWMLFLVPLVLVLTGWAFLVGGTASMTILGPLILVSLVMIIISLASWPISVERDRSGRFPMWQRTLEFPVFLTATMAWSVLSIQFFQVTTEVEMSEDFFLADIVARPWVEFAALTVFVVILAILEELIFRGGMQGALEKTFLGVPGAILVSSAIWSLGHVGYLEPHGIKELQILGLGIIFGVVKARHGLRWAVMLHVANNLFAMLLTGVDKFGG